MNSGVPLRVGSAIDEQVIRVLTDAGIRKDVSATGDSKGYIANHLNTTADITARVSAMETWKQTLAQQTLVDANPGKVPLGTEYTPRDYPNDRASYELCLRAYEARRQTIADEPYPRKWVGLTNKIKCIHIDTMANGTFMKTDMQRCMSNPKSSHERIRVANKQFMTAEAQGDVPCYVINTGTATAQIPKVQAFNIENAMTVPNLNRELLSIDDLYKHKGFSLNLKNPNLNEGHLNYTDLPSMASLKFTYL